MSAPFGEPSYADLVQQVADLHAKAAAPITLDDLPLADLRSKLIDNGAPLDLSVLALSGQVANFGADGVQIRFGAATLTYPGGNAFTNSTTVSHGLGHTPVAVLVTGTGGVTVTTANTVGATTFNALGHTDDGSLPVAGTTITVYWIAIG